MKFDELYKKVIDSCKAFEERQVPISLALKVEDFRDALVETNDTIEKLKKKLEDVQASMYCDVVDANMENRRLSRALWLKRADDAKHLVTAYENYDYLDCQKMTIKQETARTWMTCKLRTAEEWVKVWKNIERKCLKKSKEYL